MTSRPRSLAARVLAAPVHAYRFLFSWAPSRCRYWPSCSQYALDALAEHGAARGGLLALRRLARCHPWGGGGPDPVPARADRNTRSSGCPTPIAR